MRWVIFPSMIMVLIASSSSFPEGMRVVHQQ
jgi:hypothetical protein